MRVTLVYQDEEQALYVDGILRLKGRTLELSEIFQALEIQFEEKEAEFNWFWNEQDAKFPRVMQRIQFE